MGADGLAGVRELGAAKTELLGYTPGPPAVVTRTEGFRIAKSFREGISQGDVTMPAMLGFGV